MSPRSPVFVLVGIAGPPAIVGLISALVINSFECETRRLLTHIGEKIFKAVAPSIADFNAASAVVKEVFFSVWVIATRFHVRPRAKCGAPTAASMPVSGACLADLFKFKTPARLGVAGTQICALNTNLNAANTATLPMNSPAHWYAVKNSQATVLMACDINEIGHRSALSVRGQVTGSVFEALIPLRI